MSSPNADYRVELALTPGRIGANALEVVTAQTDSRPFGPRQLMLRLAAPAAAPPLAEA